MSKLDQEFEMVDVLRAEHIHRLFARRADQLVSKLRDIIDSAVSASATDDLSTDWDAIVEDAEQQIKDLMLELIGPDEKAPSETYTAEKGYHYASTLNLFKAELRQRVSEL